MDNTDKTLRPIVKDQYYGNLQIQVVCEAGRRPIDTATIKIYDRQNPDELIESLTTDISGLTKTVALKAPSLEYSMQPSEPMPYSEYLVVASAPGLQTVIIDGVQILPETASVQLIRLPVLDSTNETSKVYVVGPHYLYGSYPPKVFEPEVKEMPADDSSTITIPEYLIVHDGIPSDKTAPDYYIEYKDYIKNVVCSITYANWTKDVLYAAILSVLSFSLNRYFTNWYQRQGYSFHITSSTAYDQLWLFRRNIYENISVAVDYIFNLFLARPGILQPILTQHCRGSITDCPDMLSLWGAKALADTGYDTIYILHFYYGNDLYISYSNEVSGVDFPWQEEPLKRGSQGGNTRGLQKMLNLLSRVYPAIPMLDEDNIYGPMTESAVKTFQRIAHLPENGIVDSATWYSLTTFYNTLMSAEQRCQ